MACKLPEDHPSPHLSNRNFLPEAITHLAHPVGTSVKAKNADASWACRARFQCSAVVPGGFECRGAHHTNGRKRHQAFRVGSKPFSADVSSLASLHARLLLLGFVLKRAYSVRAPPSNCCPIGVISSNPSSEQMMDAVFVSTAHWKAHGDWRQALEPNH